jgi:hypothetical protein
MRRVWWMAWALLALGLMGVGLSRPEWPGEWRVVRGWGENLCTGCIGLTTPEGHR